MKSMLIFVLIMSIGLCSAQINSHLQLDQILPMAVRGTLTLYNNYSFDHTWYFGDLGDFEIMVDGVGSAVAYPAVPHEVTILAHDSLTVQVEHHNFIPYTIGNHYAQACILQEGRQPFGNIVPFEIEDSSSSQDMFAPGISVYPNPFSDEIKINSTQPGMIRIYNLRGQVLREIYAPAEIIWDGKDKSGRRCPPGIYFIHSEGLSDKIFKTN
jgi:hypothetical protein